MSTNQPSGSILSTRDPIFAIVVEDSVVSKWYYERIVRSWDYRNYRLVRVRASTPSTIVNRTELKFSSYINTYKYTSRQIYKPFTETEKAVWYSHFDLWRFAVKKNKPCTVIEHDAWLVKPENLIFSHDLTFYDDASMGAYTITPAAAKFLVDSVCSIEVDCGPYGMIDYLWTTRVPQLTLKQKRPNRPFMWAVKQIFNHAIGTTISHYENLPDKYRDQYNQLSLASGSLIHVDEPVNFAEKR